MTCIFDNPGESIEDRIRANLPAIREWMIDLIADVATRSLIDAQNGATENSAINTIGRRVDQTPGPGQTC